MKCHIKKKITLREFKNRKYKNFWREIDEMHHKTDKEFFRVKKNMKWKIKNMKRSFKKVSRKLSNMTDDELRARLVKLFNRELKQEK